jgi:S-formylglutathione hydrolase FrmB
LLEIESSFRSIALVTIRRLVYFPIRMAFCECHFFSDVLALSVSVSVLLPQQTTRQIGVAGGEKRAAYPTLYLLHGLSDDHTIWMRRTSIERYAAAKNLAVVMPAVARSFYQDMVSGPKYWTFVSEELPTVMRHFFPLSGARADNFAAGLSMGGYGALRLALQKPESFCAAASLSGTVDLAQRVRDAAKPDSPLTSADVRGIFGEHPRIEGSEGDLFALAQRLASGATAKPKIYLACGTEDSLIEDNRRFHRHLESLPFDNTYVEGRGGHEWGYWDAQIQRVIQWLPRGK